MLALALAFSGAACLSAQLGTDSGAGGVTGGVGGDGTGVGGGAETGGTGAGGTGEGGNGAGGHGPDAGTGGAGIDAGTGGAPVDAGAGGSPVDATVEAGYDGPTGITPNAAGQLVITEIMADTNDVPDDSGEWFEVYNPSGTDTYDLMGCALGDTNNTDTVVTHVIVLPHSSATLARFGTAAGGFTPSFDYHTTLNIDGVTLNMNADVKFSNGGDSVHVTCGLVQIDSVDFHQWLGANAMVPNGRTYSLDPSHYSSTENDVEASWCLGAMSYHSTDRGTPGQMNPTCACMNGGTPACVF